MNQEPVAVRMLMPACASGVETRQTMIKSDGELVEEARRGEDEARDELVRRYQRQATLVAAALVSDFAEGEDLGQEAFVRAFRNLDMLADPSRFGAWLRRIVVGVSIDWLRSFRPDLYRGWDGVEELGLDGGMWDGRGLEAQALNARMARSLPAAATPSPLDEVLRGEMATRVAVALAALPPRYRVPLRLFHMDGLSHSKIADTLGVPVGTVRSLVTRARRKLAPLLAEYAPEAVSQADVDEVFEAQAIASGGGARFLHVANGHSTTGTIHEAGIPGFSSIWADVLHEGPVPGDVPDEELLRIRARHLAGGMAPSYDDIVIELTRWRAVLDDDATRDELILWYEHDLFDQLNLIQVLDRLARAPGKLVSLICIGSFPARTQFKGLGELTPDELASLFETRQRVSDAQYALATRAWDAFRASDPRALEALLRTDTSALPFLAAALRRHLEEFPWTTDGVSRTERRLLSLTQSGTIDATEPVGYSGPVDRSAPIDTWTAFRRMHDDETAFFIADGSFWEIVRGLASASPPLVHLEPVPAAPSESSDASAPAGPPGLPRVTITLTATGSLVLARQADRVATCGLDRWLGGVHLQATPSAPTWRWDPTHARLDFS